MIIALLAVVALGLIEILVLMHPLKKRPKKPKTNETLAELISKYYRG